MPNNYFNFKQFKINQDQCAMKVTTEACLFGAWMANRNIGTGTVLDIGCGTGLLMLMLAQVNKGRIDGIEIDAAAAAQCRENLSASPWHERLRVFEGDVRGFGSHGKYSFILSNPPFHQSSLKSEDPRVNLARHDPSLGLTDLCDAIGENLLPDGSFGVLLPCEQAIRFEAICLPKGFHAREKMLVRQTPSYGYFRTFLHLGREVAHTVIEEELTIRERDGAYSMKFRDLLEPYYLKMDV